jgi:hypothetical protein
MAMALADGNTADAAKRRYRGGNDNIARLRRVRKVINFAITKLCKTKKIPHCGGVQAPRKNPCIFRENRMNMEDHVREGFGGHHIGFWGSLVRVFRGCLSGSSLRIFEISSSPLPSPLCTAAASPTVPCDE